MVKERIPTRLLPHRYKRSRRCFSTRKSESRIRMEDEIPFRMCEYDLDGLTLSELDRQSLVTIKLMAELVRDFFRSLLGEHFLLDHETYNKLKELATVLAQRTSIHWALPNLCVAIEDFFRSLRNFLRVPFYVRQSDGTTQTEKETCLAKILSDTSSHHIHYKCSFHMEDNLTHGFMTMMSMLNRHDEGIWTPYQLFQKAVCGLLHDIGKLNTLAYGKQKDPDKVRVSYPCHCLAGSIILRHIWGTHYQQWYTSDEWDLLCDAVLHHMCGANKEYTPLSVVFLSMLEERLRIELYDLALADVRGAAPEEIFQGGSPTCLADDTRALMQIDDIKRNATLTCKLSNKKISTFHFTRSLPSLSYIVLISLLFCFDCNVQYSIHAS
jgi:hypothetical protein